jgi:hypothetical protein
MTPVVDMTGLKGRYRMELEISLAMPVENSDMDREATVLNEFNDGLVSSPYVLRGSLPGRAAGFSCTRSL